ncbi:hypothetical protein [Myroides odoratus]|uniref:hypothetical protein n=1 Tax=Myroides odoratus TaxID=256 RepID=UPI00333FC050
MKKNILYITLIFALCFGIKVQAQNIIDYQAKLNSLSNVEANQLENLINGVPTSMHVNYDGETKIHIGNSDLVLEMAVRTSEDITKLAVAFDKELAEVIVLNIEWNGQNDIEIAADVLTKMKHLRYVYIKSYETLSDTVIQAKLQRLLLTLNQKENVEVLYTTMIEPS